MFERKEVDNRSESEYQFKKYQFLGCKLIFFAKAIYVATTKFGSFIGTDGKIEGTQIENILKKETTILQNLTADEYKFRENNMNSTYCYYGVGNQKMVLLIDIRICDSIVDELN